MAITLRGDKTSALTYGELDGNFTTLGLAHGMTTSNVAISVDTVTATTATLTTINSTTFNATDVITDGFKATEGSTYDGLGLGVLPSYETWGDATINSVKDDGSAITLVRNASSNQYGTVFQMSKNMNYDISSITSTSLSFDANLGDNSLERFLGGMTFTATDMADNAGALDVYNGKIVFTVYNKATGVNETGATPLEISSERVTVNTPTVLNIAVTNYSDLPSSPQAGDMAMLGNDGAGNPQNKPIYYSNQWQYFDDNSAVATS